MAGESFSVEYKKKVKRAIISKGWRFFTYVMLRNELGHERSDRSNMYFMNRALDQLEQDGMIKRIDSSKHCKHKRYQVLWT